MTVAHVAGVPVEETLPTLVPVVWLLAAFVRTKLGGVRRPRR
jgi:hypothetical protein